jgi:hypothetical protein
MWQRNGSANNIFILMERKVMAKAIELAYGVSKERNWQMNIDNVKNLLWLKEKSRRRPKKLKRLKGIEA